MDIDFTPADVGTDSIEHPPWKALAEGIGMKPKWQERSRDIHERFLKLAQAKGSLTSDTEILNFLALAICGEAGELANLIKKMWQGDDVDSDQIRDEIADIRIYLEHLSRHLHINLDQACENKLEVVAERLTFKENAASTLAP